MTTDEIKQMVNTCDNYHGCGCCPYNPEDISRFIGDRWKGGCPNYDRKLVYAMGKGYGDVSEYKAEIERLKDENARLTGRLGQVLLAVDTVKEMNAMCNIDDQRKQAVKEFAEKIKAKSYVNDYCREVVEIDKIDELLKEYKNGENKS